MAATSFPKLITSKFLLLSVTALEIRGLIESPGGPRTKRMISVLEVSYLMVFIVVVG